MFNQEKIDHIPARREVSRRRFLRNVGVAGIGIPALGLALEACDSSSGGKGGGGKDPWSHPGYKFTLVNHVTTNSFFVPTRYGAQDACTLLGCSYQWTGSDGSNVSEMVNAMNSAINAKSDGIGVAVIDPKGFIDPTDRALAAGIPVIAYNAAAPANSGNNQMAYIGQDLFQAGANAGHRILKQVKSGDLVAGMIGTPGQLDTQPRIDGAKSVLESAGVKFVEVATGVNQGARITAVDAWYQGHRSVKFIYAADSGSGIAVADAAKKYNLKSKGINGSGWDVSLPALQQVQSGNLEFTIDQQAYLQGFITIMQLFLYQVSGGLMSPSTTNTGLIFVTKSNVEPYLANETRFEGSSSAEKVLQTPTSIKVA